MTPNDKLIQHFYVSFQNKDFQAMQECYHSEATFNDEVFKNLSYKEVKAMWHMLCERAKDLNHDAKEAATD